MLQKIELNRQPIGLPKDPVRLARTLRNRIDRMFDDEDAWMLLHDQAYEFADRMVERILESAEHRKTLQRALDRLTFNVTAAAMRAAPLDLEAA